MQGARQAGFLTAIFHLMQVRIGGAGFCSAGVPPVVLRGVTQRKITGGTPALQNPALRSEI